MCDYACNDIADRDLAASWAGLETDAERQAEELGLRGERCCERDAVGIEDLAGIAEALAAYLVRGAR